MNNSKVIFISLILLVSLKSFSQSSMSFSLGAAVPQSDFASNDMNDDNAGGAATGVNLGVNYIYSLMDNGLGLFAGLDLSYNELRSDVKSSFEEEFVNMGIKNADYKFYSFYNIPVTVGLNYTHEIRRNVSVFGNLGITPDFLKMSEMTVSVGSQSISMTFKTNSAIGYKIGAGITLKNFLISANYYYLGNHDVTATMSGGGISQTVDGKQKINILSLSIGLKI